MKQIDDIFRRMDTWRDLPDYQLERRADIFFSLYLPEVLGAKVGCPVKDIIIPEFPVRKGIVDEDNPGDNHSYKIDYVALSKDAKIAILVELKTEMKSRRSKQDRVLDAAREVGICSLVGGVCELFRATSSDAKRKYYVLLEQIKEMGLVRIPDQLREIMSRSSLHGVTHASRQIEIIEDSIETVVVYIQPKGNGPDTISFEDFLATVRKHDDPISKRFAQSLERWAEASEGTYDL